jgi:hypothetical protein
MSSISPDLYRVVGVQSLARLRAVILADLTLADTRRREMASALKTVAIAVRKPLEMISTCPRALRPMLVGLTPTIVGVSAGRWRNTLSFLGGALRHQDPDFVPRRHDLKPSPAWASCLGLLKDGPHTTYYLGKLARYATQRGVEPAAINDASMAQFEEDLTSRSLVTEPARLAREAAKAWNCASDTYLGWPQQRLTIPDNRELFSLP